MDRFIASSVFSDSKITISLKSNMDRFIVFVINHLENTTKALKSNMDRFIVQFKFENPKRQNL